MQRGGRLRRLGLAGLMALAGGGTDVLRSQNATPQFPAGVDLARAEVQVVDSNGTPRATIRASSCDVRIDGRRRRLTAAQFVRDTSGPGSTLGASPSDGPTARNIWPDLSGAAGRTFVLAFDES